jgi:hypothetical protein
MNLLSAILRRSSYVGKELISFDRRGCMAEDWKELGRGTVVREGQVNSYDGSLDGRKVQVLYVRKADGSEFRVFRDYVMPGEASMQVRTDNPSETLVGKLVAI